MPFIQDITDTPIRPQSRRSRALVALAESGFDFMRGSPYEMLNYLGPGMSPMMKGLTPFEMPRPAVQEEPGKNWWWSTSL